jgi:hypothetical protein
VVQPEENPIVPQGQDSGNKEERDVEPSKATITIEDPLRSFIPKAPYLDRLQEPKKVEDGWTIKWFFIKRTPLCLKGKIVATRRKEMRSHLKRQLLLRILLDLLYLRRHT